MYATCWSDIGYTNTNMSKFLIMLSALHYSYFKSIVKYLLVTKDYGFHFKCTSNQPEPESAKYTNDFTLDENLPTLPVEIN